MPSCEHCWYEAQRRGVDYTTQVLSAEQRRDACTRADEDGERLRAGQFWDEQRRVDTRTVISQADGITA